MGDLGSLMSARRLVAVVVTYNRLNKLQDTVARLLEAAPADLAAVVVVDNASTDGTAAWLADQSDPRLDVVSSARNDGGAGGFGRGMTHALAAHRPDWLVLMDDDGRPAPGALAAFHALDPETQGWDGVAAAVYYPDGAICDMNRPSRNPFRHVSVFVRSVLRLGGRSGFHLKPEVYQGDVPCPIDITSFVGFFVSKKAVEAAGVPDPGLFVYGDDGLYTLGLSQAGRQLVFHPRVRFEHDCATFAAQDGRFQPLWKVYYYHRNLMFLYHAAAGWMFWPVMAVILPKWLLKGARHRGERRVFYRLLARAVWDGFRSDTSRSHAQVLALSAVEDGKVMPAQKQ